MLKQLGRLKKKRLAIALFSALLTVILLSPDFATAASGWLRISPRISHGQDAQSGATNYLQINYQNSLVKPDSAFLSMPLEARAEQVLERYGVEFGLLQPDVSLEMMKVKTPDPDRGVVRYQQTYKGIPILAGEIIYNENNAGYIQSIHGETSLNLDLSVKADIGAGAAQNIALTLIAKLYGLSSSDLTVSKAQLWVFDEDLLRKSERPVELVWRMEVTAKDGLAPIRELVLINAHDGGVSLHFNQIDTLWHGYANMHAASDPDNVPVFDHPPAPLMQGVSERDTYTANNGTTLSGTLLCDETDLPCTSGAGTDAHADAAHLYADHTYLYYWNEHGRDSIDDAGMTLISTVRYGSSYANAFWNGSQMVYGDGYGFALADDVVGHELTHGVTENESRLFYYYQSGAINESFSDIWGEFVDLDNSTGDDSLGVRWLVGEDISGLPTTAIRDMQHPPNYSDPDRIGSGLYYTTEGEFNQNNNDNGGVHINSGGFEQSCLLAN